MHGLDSHTLISFSGKQPLECLLVLCKELFAHKSNRFEFWKQSCGDIHNETYMYSIYTHIQLMGGLRGQLPHIHPINAAN